MEAQEKKEKQTGSGTNKKDNSRSLAQNVSGREKARLELDVPFTLSLSERTLFCRFRAKRARLIFHIAASLRLAVLVRTAVIA